MSFGTYADTLYKGKYDGNLDGLKMAISIATLNRPEKSEYSNAEENKAKEGKFEEVVDKGEEMCNEVVDVDAAVQRNDGEG